MTDGQVSPNPNRQHKKNLSALCGPHSFKGTPKRRTIYIQGQNMCLMCEISTQLHSWLARYLPCRSRSKLSVLGYGGWGMAQVRQTVGAGLPEPSSDDDLHQPQYTANLPPTAPLPLAATRSHGWYCVRRHALVQPPGRKGRGGGGEKGGGGLLGVCLLLKRPAPYPPVPPPGS